nr:gliding motility lipoprotein GldH [Ornithobacterium rhinotracheale]
MRIKFLISAIIAITFLACQPEGLIYQESKSLNGSWLAKDEAVFQIPVRESLSGVDLSLVLRNNEDYPFSNIYFFTEFTSPKGEKMLDTLEYQLAFPDGEWIGSGMGAIKQNTLIYKENITLKDTGIYQLKIKQAMRLNPLEGIEDISLLIQKEK